MSLLQQTCSQPLCLQRSSVWDSSASVDLVIEKKPLISALPLCDVHQRTFPLSANPHYRWLYILSSFIVVLSLCSSFFTFHLLRSYADGDDGISWPAGQVLPHFCCITSPLDEINISHVTSEQALLFETLEGLVNRSKPRIYVEQPSRENTMLWPDVMQLTFNPVANPYDLFLKYRSEIAGMVIYDPSVPDTINLATTIAGIKGGVVASPDEAARLSSTPYSLPTLVDLRQHHFASPDDVYQYIYEHYWLSRGAEHRLIIGLPPVPSGLRDYAIATKAIVVWLDAGSTADPIQKMLLDAFYQQMHAGSAYVGWYPHENPGVQESSAYGIATYAADLAQNMTVLGAGNHAIDHMYYQRHIPLLRHKIYVAMFMSDGDNVQIDEHLLAQKWADVRRGSVPIGWTIDPILLDMAPAILNYYRRTSSRNDELVAGPSGLGYVDADLLPDKALDTYTEQSAHYLTEAGIDIATVWHTTAVMPERVGNAYARHSIHELLGLTTQRRAAVDRNGARVYNHGLLSLSMGDAYASSAHELEVAIARAARRLVDHDGPIFFPVQANLNSTRISPTALYHVERYFRRNPNIVFVGPEELFELFRESLTSRSHLQSMHRQSQSRYTRGLSLAPYDHAQPRLHLRHVSRLRHTRSAKIMRNRAMPESYPIGVNGRRNGFKKARQERVVWNKSAAPRGLFPRACPPAQTRSHPGLRSMYPGISHLSFFYFDAHGIYLCYSAASNSSRFPSGSLTVKSNSPEFF